MYLWADSSPQGGVDWLLSTVMTVRASSVVSCWEAAQYLAASVDLFATAHAEEDEEKLDEVTMRRHECGILLKSEIRVHRQIPMALGAGRSDVDYKCKCMVQVQSGNRERPEQGERGPLAEPERPRARRQRGTPRDLPSPPSSVPDGRSRSC